MAFGASRGEEQRSCEATREKHKQTTATSKSITLQELWDGSTGLKKVLLRIRLNELAPNATAAIFLAKKELGMRDYRSMEESARCENKLVLPLMKMLKSKGGYEIEGPEARRAAIRASVDDTKEAAN